MWSVPAVRGPPLFDFLPRGYNFIRGILSLRGILMNDKFQFKADFIVRIGDINYGGHMANDKFLLLFHDARIGYLEALGFSEKDIGGTGIIMSDAYVRYKAEVFLGDVLTVGVKTTELEGTRFKLEYEAFRKTDEKVVALGYTTLVAFDYAGRRVSKIPEVFKQRALPESEEKPGVE